MKKKSWLLILLALTLIFVVACGETASENTTGSEPEAPAPEPEAPEEEPEAGADWPDRIVVGASSPGGSYYIFGGVMGQLIESELGITASVQDTGGGVANVQLAHAGEVDIALASNIEAGQFYYDEGMDGYAGIGAISNLPFQMVVRADSDIESWSDLEGATITMGRSNSSHDIAGRIILDALGIEAGQIINAGHDDNNSMFRDGRADAMFLGTAYPAPAFAEIDATIPLKLVAFSGEEMDTIQAESSVFGRMDVAAGGYGGQDVGVETLSYWNNFFSPKSISDEMAYEFARIIYENSQAFLDGHASALVDLENSGQFAVPLHPGAYQYLLDQGVDVPDHIIPE